RVDRMMSSMRRNPLALLSALLSALLVLAVTCPCPLPAASAPTPSAHDCCAPAAGLRAASADCCATSGLPAPHAVTVKASAPVVAAPASVALLDRLVRPVAPSTMASPLDLASSPPLVLRI